MCGLYGCITKKGAKLSKEKLGIRQRIVMGLSIAMQKRGKDSTGIGYVKDGKVGYIKQAIPAEEFMQNQKVLTLIHDSEIVVGHTRFATVGQVNNSNSHPFLIGDIMGSHNGHVTNYKQLYNAATVDSQAIFSLLHEKKNDYTEVFKLLDGMFAITWVTQQAPDRVFLVKSGNPLATIVVPSLDTIFWCTLKDDLTQTVLGGVGYNPEAAEDIDYEKVWEIQSDLSIAKTDVSFKKYQSNYDYNSGSSYAHKTLRANLPQGHYCYIGDNCNTHSLEAQIKARKKQEAREITIFTPKGKINQDDEDFEDSLGSENTIIYTTRGVTFTYEDLCEISFQIEGDGCGMCKQYIDLKANNTLIFHTIKGIAICRECLIAQGGSQWPETTFVTVNELYDMMNIVYPDIDLSKNRWKKLLHKRTKNDPEMIFKILPNGNDRFEQLYKEDHGQAVTQLKQQDFVKAGDIKTPLEEVLDKHFPINQDN